MNLKDLISLEVYGKDVTVEELHEAMGELIKQGYGDKEVWVSYDSGYASTSISRFGEIKIYDDIIRLTGD